MNALIVILVLAWLNMLLLASAGSLWLLSTWFKMPAPTYKKSLIIIAVIFAVGGVVGFAE